MLKDPNRAEGRRETSASRWFFSTNCSRSLTIPPPLSALTAGFGKALRNSPTDKKPLWPSAIHQIRVRGDRVGDPIAGTGTASIAFVAVSASKLTAGVGDWLDVLMGALEERNC